MNNFRVVTTQRFAFYLSFIIVNTSLSADNHWWHGGVNAKVNDPANWTDRDALTDPSTPGGDMTRIGASWALEDLNNNTILDPGEDLNGNGVIDDDQWASSDPGWGGYYDEEGRGINVSMDPVLSETYVSRNGNSQGGWWFVLNAPNILTLKDGAFIIWERDNCNLRNGGRLEMQGRSDEGGPSLMMAKQFRIGENGSIPAAAQQTSQLRINGTGWVQVDPFIDGSGAGLIIGTSDTPGTMPRGEIIIEENGRLELAEEGYEELYIYFGNSDPLVNQIIIRDQGELWLWGDPASMRRVGTDNTLDNATEISFQDMINTRLIINDQGGQIEVSGSGPTVVEASGVVGVKDNAVKFPGKFNLNQNYPNLFNPSTKIQYTIPQNGEVKLIVYNIHGEEIAVLVNDFEMPVLIRCHLMVQITRAVSIFKSLKQMALV